MTEIVMRKRASRNVGEIGLFVETEVFEEDFSHIKMDAEVKVVATQPRSLRQLKFAWALAGKIADACDWVESKEDCMDYMMIEAKHFRRIYDPLRGVAVLKPKPTNFAAMDGIAYTRLLKRIVYVATTIMVPGLDDSVLKAEIEAMIGPDTEPARAPAAKPMAARKPAVEQASPEPPLADPAPIQEGGEPNTAEAEDVQRAHTASPNRPLPQNEAEYIAAARSWIGKQTDHAKALEYMDSTAQIELRAACKLSVGSNKMLRRELADHIETFKGTAK